MAMRNGPKPLSVHLGMTGAFLQGQENAAKALSEMIRGIQYYQKAEYKPHRSKRDIIWQSGQTTLQKIQCEVVGSVSGEQPRPSCILIPSLINGSDILDLCEQRSLASWLGAQGMDIYLLDWGNLLQEDDKDISISNLVEERLCVALLYLKERIGDAPLHGLGYCMGGALTLGAAHVHPDIFKSITLLATPWDFFAGTQTLLNRVRFWAPSALHGVALTGFLSADALQSLFASVDPMLTQKKFSRYANMDQNSHEAKLFIAVEDWLNDGKSLPNVIAKECIEGWFLQNKPYSGAWELDGHMVNPSRIETPVLIVASKADRLVEFDSAASLKAILPNASLCEVTCGHIGMIAGKHSIAQVWEPIAQWMKNYNPQG